MDMTSAQEKALKRHRQRLVKKGYVRMELGVPKQDRELLRFVASELRQGGPVADRMRMVLKSALAGEELLDFKKYLELAPLEGVDLVRSPDTGNRKPEI